MRLDELSRDDWIVGGLALLLAISLIVLPWFSYSIGGLATFTLSATDAPDGWTGIIASIVLAAGLFYVTLRLSQDQPIVSRSDGRS